MRRLVLPLLLVLLTTSLTFAQPLYDWVNRPDAAFAWEKVKVADFPGGVQVTELKMTSQVWQGITWTHQVVIIKPAQLTTPDTAVLLINGGKLDPGMMGMVAPLAAGIGAPLVYLGDIPNQPLFNNLREDALIAYTYQKALQTQDMTWPLLYPMTKSAVRAMDCVEQFTQQEWPTPIKRFVVTGASKRGWTTWFTGCLNQGRVIGIVPLVYDNLDLPRQMALQKSAYGVYSSQIEDYTALGLPDLLQTPEGKRFGAEVDPYTFRDKMTMPKLIITGTNDPYWVLDSANLYWSDLPDPKYILYVPNGPHTLNDIMRVINAEVGFFHCCAGRAPFPKLQWEFADTGDGVQLTITSDPTPAKVLLWSTTAATRDFRQSVWQSQEVTPAEGKYVLRLKQPAQGYAALLGEAHYDLAGRDVPFSTNVRILNPPGQ